MRGVKTGRSAVKTGGGGGKSGRGDIKTNSGGVKTGRVELIQTGVETSMQGWS